MLESIILKEFQCHKKFVLRFDPHVTTICGPSDHGKSAILRALRWLAINKPSGDGFVRRNGSTKKAIASVRLRIDEHSVKRIRGSGRNLFEFDGKQFAAFGTEVPGEIEKLLNVGPANFAGQFDAPLWFSQSAGEVSRALNEIVDLTLIDRTLGNLAAEARKAKAEADVCRDRLKSAETERDRLAWVTEAAKDLEAVEAAEKRLEGIREKRSRLAEIVEKVKRCSEAVETSSRGYSVAAKAVSAGERVLEIRSRRERLEAMIVRIGKLEKEAKELRGKAEEVEEELAGQENCPLCGKVMK